MRIGREDDALRDCRRAAKTAVEPNQRIEIAPIRAFCASCDPSTHQETHPVHKFFSCRRRRRAAVPRRLKFRARTTRQNCPRRANSEISKQRKPHFIRTSSHREKCARDFASKKSFRVWRRVAVRFVRCAQQRGARLTHKIKWSHCYFFFAVVIGMECGSIRDCTAPISPTHSS